VTTTPPQPSATPGGGRRRRFRWKRAVAIAAVVLVVLFAAIQLVPYGRSTTNPPVTRAAKIPDAVTGNLLSSACNDCHSNLTKRWWATRIAPASWLAENDVRGGREHLNFSEWDRSQSELQEVVDAVEGGSMPPLQYKLVHGNARLSDAERTQLVDGLRRLYATDPPAATHGG
jgi:hypothetical protein